MITITCKIQALQCIPKFGLEQIRTRASEHEMETLLSTLSLLHLYSHS